MIQLTNVNKTYNNGAPLHVLKGINLNIEQGEFVSIMGASGSGKSTLLNILGILDNYDTGEYYLNNVLIKNLSETKAAEYRNRMIGFIFQSFNLISFKDAVENVALPLFYQGISRKKRNALALEYLDRLGLKDWAHHMPNEMSGGQKQRVAIARALASDPKILLCDEATSALDPQTTASILALLKDINEKFGITIVIITHQMAVIREICKHVAILNHGVLVEEGEVEEIFNHPKSEAARELILGDISENQWNGETRQKERVLEDKCLRIVFTENSAFEPVIANMILKFGVPVNILKADTKNVGGIAKGEMILGLPEGHELQEQIKAYMVEKGLEIEEVTQYV